MAVDQENLSVGDEKVKPKEAIPEPSSGGGDVNIEDKIIDEIGPGAS